MRSPSAHQLAALALLLGSAFSAHATGTLYTDVGSYQAALAAAGLTTQIHADFEAAAAAGGLLHAGEYFGVQDPTPIVVGPVTLTGLNSANANGGLTLDNYGIAHAFYDHGLYTGTDNALTIRFATPVMAFAFESNAFNVTIDGPTGPLPMTLTTDTGEVVSAFTSPLYWGGVAVGTAPIVFNGFVSNVAFSSVTVAAQTQDFNITSISAAAVPEPSTYGLLLSGLGVLGALARCQRKEQPKNL
jgi:hypothetical protein